LATYTTVEDGHVVAEGVRYVYETGGCIHRDGAGIAAHRNVFYESAGLQVDYRDGAIELVRGVEATPLLV
jgi:hypothetical protein